MSAWLLDLVEEAALYGRGPETLQLLNMEVIRLHPSYERYYILFIDILRGLKKMNVGPVLFQHSIVRTGSVTVKPVWSRGRGYPLLYLTIPEKFWIS